MGRAKSWCAGRTRCVILEAADDWPDRFRACLGAWRGKIPRPTQQRVRISA